MISKVVHNHMSTSSSTSFSSVDSIQVWKAPCCWKPLGQTSYSLHMTKSTEQFSLLLSHQQMTQCTCCPSHCSGPFAVSPVAPSTSLLVSPHRLKLSTLESPGIAKLQSIVYGLNLPTSQLFFFLIFILFICAYNVWVISPPFPHPFPYPPPRLLPVPLYPLATQQKLFCPYL
jgi:hypothetical protein